MQGLNFALGVLLLLMLGAAIWRAIRGPAAADRMLAVQSFGTITVAALLLLAQGSNIPALRDVALVLALLAAVTAVAFVRRAWPEKEAECDLE